MNRYSIRWEAAERVWSVWTFDGWWVAEFPTLLEAERFACEAEQ